MPTPEPNVPTTVNDEIAAMRRITRELDRLDPRTRERAVGWLHDRYTKPAADLGDVLRFGQHREPGTP